MKREQHPARDRLRRVSCIPRSARRSPRRHAQERAISASITPCAPRTCSGNDPHGTARPSRTEINSYVDRYLKVPRKCSAHFPLRTSVMSAAALAKADRDRRPACAGHHRRQSQQIGIPSVEKRRQRRSCGSRASASRHARRAPRALLLSEIARASSRCRHGPAFAPATCARRNSTRDLKENISCHASRTG